MKMNFPEDRYTEVRGLGIRYWKIGDGPPLLLIHGLGASAEIWMHNYEAFSRDYTVYVPDVPGFGRSEKPRGPCSMSDLLMGFTGQFMDSLGIERAHLVGQSLGGGMALKTALQCPERVDKLVLVGSAGLGSGVMHALRLMSLPVIGELLSRPSRIGARIFFSLAVKDRSVLTRDFLDCYYRLFSLPGAQRMLLATVREIVDMGGARDHLVRPIMDNLQRLTQPALIIWGRQDRVLPVRQAHFAHENLAGSRLVIYDHCGHVVNLERPREFNRDVLDFLSL